MAARPKPASIDAYIEICPPEVQAILQRVRTIIRKAAPRAAEKISYGIPAFTLDGGMLIYFAAFKTHIGLYPPLRGDAALLHELAPYRGDKGNLKFPLGQRMPYGLIGKVVKARSKEQGAKAAPKSLKRPR